MIIIWLWVLSPIKAQLQESFADGDFTQNPVWVGEVEYFQINAALQLQSKGPAVTGSTIHLATESNLAVGVQWEYYVQLAFATSSGNYAETHLISDGPDLKGATRGYFVRMGGTEDEVSLYRKDGSTSTRIINGPDKTIAANDNRFWVRVTRTTSHEWTLELDVTGTRQNYQLQGTVQDARYVSSAYTGVVFRYSQANAQRFFFDDYSIKDISAPAIAKIEALDARNLEVTLTKAIRQAEAENQSNYLLNENLRPTSAQWLANAPNQVRLTFNQDFNTGINKLEIATLVDQSGNEAQSLAGAFSYSPRAAPGEVRITEIYADVNPLQDLPAAEFFELYNRSNKTFNLQGWQYSDATASVATFPAYLLEPGAYVIVCAAADTSLYKPFGPVVGLPTFPSLNDSGDEVEVFDNTGQRIDFVRYSNSWYREAAKREGGWSLELMNVNSLCTGASQWKGSENPRGGTPGQPNSIQIQDVEAPEVRQVYATGPDRIIVQFSETVDSVQAANAVNYSVTPGVTVQRARRTGNTNTEVELLLASTLQPNTRYAVTVSGVRDCSGNVISGSQAVALVLADSPVAGDIVINEILFNPNSGGVDFVEIVNRSAKYLNLQNWQLANKEAGEVANQRTISTQNLLIAPGQYLAITTNTTVLQAHYPAAVPERLWSMASLPSYPDAAGTVVLLMPNGAVADEVSYRSAQHFKLLRDAEGVSLERISLAGPSVEANFHSAATNVKATPGYRNSQAREAGIGGASKLELTPKVITPDGDGVDDVLLLQFKLPQAGFVASVQIFDASGRLVRKLAGNTLLGAEELLQWDGLKDNGSKAAIGYYIVLVNLFDLQGKQETIKETMVVGGRF